MARDGSGNYNLPAGNPVVTGTVISSTQFNSTMTDIATAMTQSISKDGQTTPANNLPMGGNKHTGVADGNLGNQYASINQTQNGSLSKATAVANVVDAYTASLTPAIASYTDGQVVTFVPSVTNTTTTVTLALNGLAAKPVNKEGGVACVAGDIVLNVPVYLVYYATGGYFLLLNPQKITATRFTSPLTLPAPGTAVTAVTVNQAAGSATIGLQIVGATGQAAQLAIQDGQTGTRNWRLIAGQTGAGTFDLYDSTRGVVTLSASAAGVFTFSAPTSGPVISATGAAGQAVAVFNAGSSASVGLRVLDPGVNGIIADLDTTNAEASLRASGTGATLGLYTAGAVRLTIANGGNVAIPAPASGPALTANGVAGAQALFIAGASTSGSSFGIQINAGTTSADYAFSVFNQTTTLNAFKVRGDGVVFGNDGTNLLELGYKDTPLNTPGGSYTLTAADRGKTIVVANGATITVPNAVFSGGAVVSFMIASGATATIAQGASFTLGWAGNGATTGSRTITGAGLATVAFSSTSAGLISGAGLT